MEQCDSARQVEPFLSLHRGGGVIRGEPPQVVPVIHLEASHGLCVLDWMLALTMLVLGEVAAVTWRHLVDSKVVRWMAWQMAGQKQKQADQPAVRGVPLHSFHGMSPAGEGEIRSFPSFLLVLGASRKYCCLCLAMPEKAARPKMTVT